MEGKERSESGGVGGREEGEERDRHLMGGKEGVAGKKGDNEREKRREKNEIEGERKRDGYSHNDIKREKVESERHFLTRGREKELEETRRGRKRRRQIYNKEEG